MAKPPSRPGMVLIFRPFITVRGKRIYAWQRGKKVFAFWVKKEKPNKAA